MNKKTRLAILLVCVVCFLIIAPILVLYSMGYRVDLEKMEITATGGIYVRTFPSADQITIDSNVPEKPGLFANSIFVQSLLPKNHTVSIKKSGYYDYYKTLTVKENQVTKLENVLLFKNNIGFEIITDQTKSPFNLITKFLIKNNNLYYSNAPENSSLTAIQKATPILKKLTAFTLQNNDILWLGTDGFLYRSDVNNLSATPTKIIINALKINKLGSYKIMAYNNDIFVNDNSNLLVLNKKTNDLDNFASQVKGGKFSPDGKNVIYYNDKKIYISLLVDEPIKTLLYESSEPIIDLVWLNNDYIIVALANKIIISEIDYRGNVNIVTLPQNIITGEKQIAIKNPEISFDHQNGKLYVLTGKILLLTEKIVP